MPQIPQISGPLAGGKGLSPNNGSAQGANSEPFELNGVPSTQTVSGVAQKTGGSTGSLSFSQSELSGLSTPIAKDPAMAVETLKDVINEELLASAKLNGYTELSGEIENLNKSLYLAPDGLVNEILTQEQDNTSFSGNALFDILRNLTNGTQEMKDSVANLLKGINFAQSREEILSAVTSNIKFLSEYFGKNTTISKNLTELYNAWNKGNAGENFEALKNQTTAVLRTVSESLQNDEHTAALIPLVIHNLSRYNTNEYMIVDAFSQLLTQVPSNAVREELQTSFESLLSNMFGDRGNSFINNTTFDGKNQVPATIFGYNNENQSELPTATPNTPAGQPAVSQQTDGGGEFTQAVFPDFSTDASAGTAKAQAAENPEAQPSVQGEQGAAPAVQTEKLSPGTLISLLSNEISNVKLMLAENVAAEAASSHAAGKTDGITALKQIISALIPGGKENAAVLDSKMSELTDLKSLVGFLNDVLDKLPVVGERAALCDSLEEIVAKMAQNHELPTEKPVFSPKSDSSTMETLTGFIEKNVNHPAIKSVDNFNASNLLQSMLNAPGVFTPLSHYILPLQIDDTRAFGELWVDNDSEEKGGASSDGKKNYHMFLTFDVEAIGRFEVNVYANDKNLNMSVLYPESYRKKAGELPSKITRIASKLGYSTQDFKTGILGEPHRLSEVFPKINRNRGSFNVKA